MDELLNIYKPQGSTPFQIIKQLREKRPELRDVKIGYAGRLDPLAHGVLLLMIGEANKKREQYLGLEKAYEFRVVFGLETDTYDYLGMLKSPQPPLRKGGDAKDVISPPLGKGGVPQDGGFASEIEKFIKSKIGQQVQTYPPFSSKTINGIPLFQLSKDGKLEGKELPSRKVTIKEFACLGIDTISSEDLKETILSNIAKIEGDFRQKEIIEQWEAFFRDKDEEFVTARFSLTCSSGTYVRSLVNMLGEELCCGAIALEILRTRVGKYELKDSLKI